MWKAILVWWLLNNTNKTVIKEVKNKELIDTNGEKWEDFAQEGDLSIIPLDKKTTITVAKLVCGKKRRMNKDFFNHLLKAVALETDETAKTNKVKHQAVSQGRYGGEW